MWRPGSEFQGETVLSVYLLVEAVKGSLRVDVTPYPMLSITQWSEALTSWELLHWSVISLYSSIPAADPTAQDN